MALNFHPLTLFGYFPDGLLTGWYPACVSGLLSTGYVTGMYIWPVSPAMYPACIFGRSVRLCIRLVYRHTLRHFIMSGLKYGPFQACRIAGNAIFRIGSRFTGSRGPVYRGLRYT